MKHLTVNVTEYSAAHGFITRELTQVDYETAELINSLTADRMAELAEQIEPLGNSQGEH